MIARRLFVVAICAACLMAEAAAEPTVIRPGPCATHQATYLLAANSGALIRAQPGTDGSVSDHVIVFRPKPTTGWASQRLLMRFDLRLDDNGARIVNSGAFCMETN